MPVIGYESLPENVSRPRASRAGVVGVLQEPAVRGADSFFELDSRRPPESRQTRRVEKLAGGAVGFRAIEARRPAETHDPGDRRRQFGYAQVAPPPDVDPRLAVVALHEEQAGIGEIVHVQEFAARGPGAPDLDVAGAL